METAGSSSPSPAPLPLLQGDGLLTRAGAPSVRVFSAAGAGALARGSELRGLAEVRTARWTLLSELETGCGPSSGVVVGPFSLRREALRAGASVLETFLLPVELPGAALQWRRPQGDPAPLSLTLAWTVTANGEDGPGDAVSGSPGVALVAEIEAGELRVRRADAVDEARFLIHPAPERWSVQEDRSGLRVEAIVGATPGRAITLLLAAGDGVFEAGRVAERLERLAVEESRAEQATRDLLAGGLVTGTGVPDLDEGLAWAKLRIAGASVRRAGEAGLRRGGGACGDGPPPGGDPAGEAEGTGPLSRRAEEAWLALGAIAAGDGGPAEVLLRGDLPTPLHLLVAARHGAWSGESAALVRHSERILRGVEAALASVAMAPAATAPGTNPMERVAATRAVAAILLELADAWEGLGERGEAAALRDRVAQRASRAGASGARGAPAGARRLPMAGGAAGRGALESGAPTPSGAAWELLAGLLGVSSTPANARIQPAGATLAGALGAWAHLAAGDAERGYALFREHLALGFRHGTGVWPERLPAEAGSPPAGCLDHAAAAAMVPAILLFGLLGARGDAPVGRLRLAPRFPASWPSFRVAGIRLGDGEVELDYERDRDRHTFRARQPRGRVPFMLVLEPEVPARRLAKVEIDGKEAVLDHFQRGGRVGARVQLPLDRERNVTLVAAQGA